MRKNLTGRLTGLAEQCIAAINDLDPNLAMRFSRKSYETLTCYASDDQQALASVLKPRKRRRTGAKPSSQGRANDNDNDDNNNDDNNDDNNDVQDNNDDDNNDDDNINNNDINRQEYTFLDVDDDDE